MSQLQKNVSTLSRRQCLRAAFYSATAGLSAPLLSACGTESGSASPSAAASAVTQGGPELNIPLGPLSKVGNLVLDAATQVRVPAGFGIRAIATANTPVPTPGGAGVNTFPFNWHINPDGGATFAQPGGGWVYTSNSEATPGGCGAIAFDASGAVVDAYSILNGTANNCAGGATPWDTWVSCEETANGQCWECDPFQPGQGVAKPSLGFFAHEAIAVDPVNNVVYLTEDTGSGRFYRWVADPTDVIPNSGGRLALETGVLQVLNIDGFEDGGYPTDPADVRQLRGVSWQDAVRPQDPQTTVRNDLALANQTVPGTNFKGGEGLWYYSLPATVNTVPQGGTVPTRGLVFFSTKGDNRVWALDIDNQLIELVFDNDQIEPDFGDVDNITISPWGDVIVAEDPPTSPNSRIMVVLPNAESVVLVVCEHPGSEICGPAFSPDGRRLYFSSQRRFGGETYELTIPERVING